jgi:hypothetical protein
MHKGTKQQVLFKWARFLWRGLLDNHNSRSNQPPQCLVQVAFEDVCIERAWSAKCLRSTTGNRIFDAVEFKRVLSVQSKPNLGCKLGGPSKNFSM